MLHITVSIFADSVTEPSTEQRIRLTFVACCSGGDRAGNKSGLTHTQISLSYLRGGKKKVCYCASAQEGCVGKSKHCAPILFGTVCPVFSVPKLLNTHMQRHTRQIWWDPG